MISSCFNFECLCCTAEEGCSWWPHITKSRGGATDCSNPIQSFGFYSDFCQIYNSQDNLIDYSGKDKASDFISIQLTISQHTKFKKTAKRHEHQQEIFLFLHMLRSDSMSCHLSSTCCCSKKTSGPKD